MLFGTKVFGTRMFNGGDTVALTYSSDRVVFENFSLSDGSVMVLTTLLDSGPTRDLEGGPVPRGDGEYLTSAYFRDRVIEASGIVRADSAAELDAYLDTIRRALRTQEGDLGVTDSNSTAKRFIATCDNYEGLFADRQHFHVNFCPFKARFRCKTPFGKARGYTSTILSTSSSPTTQTLTNSGTYKALPVITLIFDAASSVTAVSIANVTTGESITYTGSIAAGNVLVFDSETKQVTKTGTAVDFTGAFPTLEVNSNAITITVTGSSFTAVVTYAHKLTYL